MNAESVIAAVQQLHQKRTGRAIGFADDMPDEDFCNECSTIGTHVLWPCPTARLVYTGPSDVERAVGSAPWGYRP